MAPSAVVLLLYIVVIKRPTTRWLWTSGLWAASEEVHLQEAVRRIL
jgi:hypothetical protein